MARFMYKVRYSREGLEGMAKEGFADREAYVRKLISDLGLTMESMFWAMGDEDLYAVVDGDETTALGASLAFNLSGIGRVSTVRLLTAPEMDAAVAKIPKYRAPGG